MLKKLKLALLAVTVFGYGVGSPATSFAQGGKRAYFLKAEKLLKKQKFAEAAQYYEKYLSSERTITAPVDKRQSNSKKVHQRAVYNIAESYRQSHDYQNAEKYYGEAAVYSEDRYPASAYWYAVSLRANKKYKEAITVLTSYRERHTQMDSLTTLIDRELFNLEFIKAQLDNRYPEFVVTPLVSPTNTSSYAAALVGGDTIVISAVKEPEVVPMVVETRKKSWFSFLRKKKKEPAPPQKYVRLYETEFKDNEFLRAGELDIQTIGNAHDGLATFAGDKMFFTRWQEVNGQQVSAIYVSKKTGASWSTPQKMGTPVNIEKTNSTQPFITADGKHLLFSSNREGGIGKYDIWHAELDGDYNVVRVINMGNVINTTEDEYSPVYHSESGTLVFSSNGRIGMGGFDIYSSKGSISVSDWAQPENAGSPVNSGKDDLYFMSTDTDNFWNEGLLSSDRDTTSCSLGLYRVLQENLQVIKGSVIECNNQYQVGDATVSIQDKKNGKVLQEVNTDENGNYTFEISNTSSFIVAVKKTGFEPTIENHTRPINAGVNEIQLDPICLNRDADNPTDSLQQILDLLSRSSSTLAQFGFNKSTINDPSGAMDTLVALMNEFPNLTIEIAGHTDSRGSAEYNLLLAKKRVDACINYLVKKGVDKSRLLGKAYGECCPLVPELVNGKDDPGARRQNRRVEYKIIR